MTVINFSRRSIAYLINLNYIVIDTICGEKGKLYVYSYPVKSWYGELFGSANPGQ